MKRIRRIRYFPPLVVATVISTVFLLFAIRAIDSSAEAVNTKEPPEAAHITEAERNEITHETHGNATEPPEKDTQTLIYSRDWSGEDSEILLKIAMAEAEGEGVEGKALVMLVVLNRVWSDDFPGTISEVVFQKNQFSPTAEGGRYWTTKPDRECYEALELIEGGWDESRGALYFESCERDSWHSRNLEFIFQHGNHRFYK